MPNGLTNVQRHKLAELQISANLRLSISDIYKGLILRQVKVIKRLTIDHERCTARWRARCPSSQPPVRVRVQQHLSLPPPSLRRMYTDQRTHITSPSRSVRLQRVGTPGSGAVCKAPEDSSYNYGGNRLGVAGRECTPLLFINLSLLGG